MLLPLMMPPVITALMWKIMMASTNAGILNHMLSFIGVDPINWFGSTDGAVVSILIIDTWGNLPFVALILLGGAAGPADRAVRGGARRRRRPRRHPALRHPAAAQPVHRAGRAVPDDGFAPDLRRDLRHDAGRAERRDHQPAHHGVPVFLPVVPDGQGHGPGRSSCSCWSSSCSYLLMRLWNRASESTPMTARRAVLPRTSVPECRHRGWRPPCCCSGPSFRSSGSC